MFKIQLAINEEEMFMGFFSKDVILMSTLSTIINLIYIISMIYPYDNSKEQLKVNSANLSAFHRELDNHDMYMIKETVEEQGGAHLLGKLDENLEITFRDLSKGLNDIVEINSIKRDGITYNPEDLSEESNLTKNEIRELLKGSELEVLADKYHEMEEKYDVNAIFLMALNMEESGHGTSYLAQAQNNLGGVKNRYGDFATFNSWSESLDYIANLISSEYLHPEGSYYNGTSIYGVNIKYCEGNQWAHNLNKIANEIVNKFDIIEMKL